MIPATEPAVAPPGSDDDDLLTRKEASAFLIQFGIRMKPETLARLWSTGGNGPPCRHVRHKPFYPRGVLRAWALDQVSDLRASAPPAAKGRRHA
ncbi:hypothetical protein BH09PSE1_BH09PSE1_02160 [soil metagenome]